MEIEKELFALRDAEYARFQGSLIPTVSPERIIGVRVPQLRKLARACAKTAEGEAFLRALPHAYFDEDMLHALLLAQMREFDACLASVERFLPYVDNWAVCDGLSPKVFGGHRAELLPHICEWTASEHVYTCRFGLGMLLRHFLDEAFAPEYLEIAATVRSEEYYVKMMLAWLFATALAKQWDAAVPYLEQARLDVWVHNKTIQKACESYRVSEEHKAAVRLLRRKA